MQSLPEIRLCVEETGWEAEQRLLRRKQVSHAIPSGGSSPPLPLPSCVRVKYSSLLPGSENRRCKSLHKPLPEPPAAMNVPGTSPKNNWYWCSLSHIRKRSYMDILIAADGRILSGYLRKARNRRWRSDP